jgi:hypothetical protein
MFFPSNTDCLKYNLSENVMRCYYENPFQLIIDNQINILIICIIIIGFFYLLNRFLYKEVK